MISLLCTINLADQPSSDCGKETAGRPPRRYAAVAAARASGISFRRAQCFGAIAGRNLVGESSLCTQSSPTSNRQVNAAERRILASATLCFGDDGRGGRCRPSRVVEVFNETQIEPSPDVVKPSSHAAGCRDSGQRKFGDLAVHRHAARRGKPAGLADHSAARRRTTNGRSSRPRARDARPLNSVGPCRVRSGLRPILAFLRFQITRILRQAQAAWRRDRRSLSCSGNSVGPEPLRL